MIEDPIVIRKARGALIVSSTKATDPIQLIRQVSANELEVHLKNGSKYIEDVEGVDMMEVIMEMMGFIHYEVHVATTMWPKHYEGKLTFLDGVALHCAGLSAFRCMFAETPYLSNKFLGVSVKKTEAERTYYDTKYTQYAVECMFAFRGRVDMGREIECAFDEDVPWLVKYLVAEGHDQVSAEDGRVKIKSILE